MRKISNWIDNFCIVENGEKLKLLKLLDSFLFFSDEWMFVQNKEFFVYILDEFNITIEDFMNVGNKLANNLNKINLDVLDYDVDKIEEYLNI